MSDERSVTDLRWLTIDEAVAAGRRHAADAALGLDDGPPIFRDPAGRYWQIGAADEWRVLGGSGWSASPAPTTMLEGAADLDWTVGQARPPVGVDPAEEVIQADPVVSLARWRAAYSAGSLSSGELEDRLASAVVTDAAGACWTIGFVSGGWYRFTEGAWRASREAPVLAAQSGGGAVEGSNIEACPACGAAGGGRRFCGDCGTELQPAAATATAAPGTVDYLLNGLGSLPEAPTPPWSPPPPESSRPASSPAATTTRSPALAARRRPPGLGTWVGVARSSASLAIGVVLMAGSLTGFGPFATTATADPRPSLAPDATAVVEPTGADVSSASPSTEPSVSPAPSAVASPSPAPSPAPFADAWFADSFETEAAWFVGDQDYLSARYEVGRYEVTVQPVDLPVALWAASEQGPGPESTFEVSVAFTTGSGSTEAGLIVRAEDGYSSLEFVTRPDGTWSLYRDDIESFRTLLQGATTPPSPGIPVRLALRLTGSQAGVSLDGIGLGAADDSLTPTSFGVALRAFDEPGSVWFDDYAVTTPGS